MKKSQPNPVGRPPIGDRAMTRYQVILDDETVERARKLGGGNLSLGIRLRFMSAKNEGKK